MPDNTPVTQEDREAAAEIAETLLINSDLFPALIRNGEHDAHPFVQSYARHRISHSLPGDVGMRENDKPPAHWTPNPRYEQPQTVEEWDWRQDGSASGNSFDRSRKRLTYAYVRADPHAPDQMALVLRVDLGRILGRLTHYTAHRKFLMEQRDAALTPSALSGDNHQSSSNAGGDAPLTQKGATLQAKADSAIGWMRRAAAAEIKIIEVTEAFEKIATGRINGEPENARDTLAVIRGIATEALASLSTPTAEPDPDDRAQNKAGGLWYRRWHDAQTRVNELEYMLANPPEPTGDSLGAGLERAAQWHDARCKGPDVFEQELHENSAKALRHLAANPDATDMQALEAALTTPPTPDRIGKDAVREAVAVKMVSHDEMAEHPASILARALSATPAQEVFPQAGKNSEIGHSATPAPTVDETERLREAVEAFNAADLNERVVAAAFMNGLSDELSTASRKAAGCAARAALQHKGEVSRG